MTVRWLTAVPAAVLLAGCSASTASSGPSPTAVGSAGSASTPGGLTSGTSGAASTSSVPSAPGTAATPTPPPPTSIPSSGGVFHLVTEEGPTCPVQRIGQPPCVRPLAASVEVTPTSGGRSGTEVSTGASGTADVSLPAGMYTLHALSPGGGSQSFPRPPEDQTAAVTAGATVTVTMVWDTGIR